MVITAFKFEGEIYSELTWLPRDPTLSNFQAVITEFQIPIYLRNTLIVALSTTLIVVVVSVLAAYALTLCAFRGVGSVGAQVPLSTWCLARCCSFPCT